MFASQLVSTWISSIVQQQQLNLAIVVGICYDLIRNNICNRMGYNGDAMDEIILGDVSIFSEMTVIIDMSITISTFISFLNTLTNVFDETYLTLDKLNEYECEYNNNTDTSTTTNTFHKIGGATHIVGLLRDTVMDGLQINTIASNEFDVIIITMNQLILILAVQSSIFAVYCDSPMIMICKVCGVFIIFFYFFYHSIYCSFFSL